MTTSHNDTIHQFTNDVDPRIFPIGKNFPLKLFLDGSPDKDYFMPTKPWSKWRGHKRSFRDRQNDEGFNYFEFFETLDLKEGILHDVTLGTIVMGMDDV